MDPFFITPDEVPKLNPKQIYILARDDSIIATTLSLWHRGFYSWEQMLIHCITALVEANKKLVEDNIDLLSSKHPQPVIIKYDGKCGE